MPETNFVDEVDTTDGDGQYAAQAYWLALSLNNVYYNILTVISHRRVKCCENTISNLIHDIEAQKDCIRIHKWIFLFIYKIPIITWNTETMQDVDNEWRHSSELGMWRHFLCNRRQPNSVGQLAALGLAI